MSQREIHIVASNSQEYDDEFGQDNKMVSLKQNNYGKINDIAIQEVEKKSPFLRQAPTASIGVLFGLLIWRSYTAFELSDGFSSVLLKLFTKTPVSIILLADVVGFLVNLVKPHNFKNYLKVILGLNLIREIIELVYNLFKVIFTPSHGIISREFYVGRLVMNLWWFSLCMAFQKSRWVAQQTQQRNFQNIF